MPSTDTKAQIASAGWLSRGWRIWEKIAAFLALIALVDITKQLIEWAALIHRIAETYATVRAWLFGWLPFHIPPDWHDPIVLFLIFFSVTNVGIYQEARMNLVKFIGIVFIYTPIQSGGLARVFAVGVILSILVITPLAFLFNLEGVWLFLFIIVCVIVFVMPMYLGVLIAIRWVLATAAIFGALVAINYAYLQWLEPLAERH